MKSSFKKSTQNRRIYGWLQAGIRTTVAVKSENGGCSDSTRAERITHKIGLCCSLYTGSSDLSFWRSESL